MKGGAHPSLFAALCFHDSKAVPIPFALLVDRVSLFTWLSLLMSLMVSYFVLSFFPRDVMDEIWD